MPLSSRHPWLYALSVRRQCVARDAADALRRTRFATDRLAVPLPVVVVRHQSLLRRRLGSSDPRLQETKIVNLRLAAASVDGLLLRPGDTFSFWRCVGPPTAARGFTTGLMLSRGKVREAVGGGLCQLSNLLYWMALHTTLTVTERHHHGFDPFPDDRRSLPFGSGATVYYNYGDLRFENRTDAAFRLAVRVGERHLIGSIGADRPLPVAFHVVERGHRFVEGEDGRVYRKNELWRRVVDRRTGDLLAMELITRNRCLVMYPVPLAGVELPPVAAQRRGSSRVTGA